MLSRRAIGSGPVAGSVRISALQRISASLPCCVDPDLWFADSPRELELAKTFCAACPARGPCLAGALIRQEPWGVWGGEIFDHGRIVARKRGRGRPRKDAIAA